MVTAAAIRDALRTIPDPEMPVVTIEELGILGSVVVGRDRIRVELHPTFVACPATELIREAVGQRLAELVPTSGAEVAFVYDPPWTSDRISESGRARLSAAGMAPPLPAENTLIALDQPVPCPFCGSSRTRLENAFGPTLCRAIRWCPDCRQPFEQIKSL